MPSLIRWILWVLLFQFVLINISASLYAYRLTHFYDDPSLRVNHASGNILRKTWKLFTGPRFPKSVITGLPDFAYDTVQLKTETGILIDAWYAKPDSLAKGTVILFHGISANKSYLVHEAAEFRRQGYAVMLVDFRAHGNSGGLVTTMGMREEEEVKLACDYVKGRGEKNIFLWGVSMGAVVLTRAVGDYSLDPSGIILEMPFSSLQSHLKARARVLGFPQQPFAFLVTGWIGLERGFNGYGHSTVRYAKKISCPVLVQYGEKDSYVLKSEIDEIYHAIASTDKALAGYPNADHESLLLNDPDRWVQVVGDFLEKKRK
ncbi:MAG: alpha/beta hydrolase [Sphingobacteriales bacterium]|nr:alpha/beta hydrolase [Sphingobacteriales bacterium]